MEELIPHFAENLGIEPSTLLSILIVVSVIGNITGRLIPDDKGGAVGVIRDIAKFLGGYVQNRVSTGVKTGDVVKSIVESRVEKSKAQLPATVELTDIVTPEVAEELIEEAAPKPVPAFPGLLNKTESRDDFPKEF